MHVITAFYVFSNNSLATLTYQQTRLQRGLMLIPTQPVSA